MVFIFMMSGASRSSKRRSFPDVCDCSDFHGYGRGFDDFSGGLFFLFFFEFTVTSRDRQ